MAEQMYPTLMCATEENNYQILSDSRYLYFVRLGKIGREDSASPIRTPEEYAAEWGNVRMPKSGVESVRCARVNGEMIILIGQGERSYKFVADVDVSENLLMDVFSDLPLHMTMKQSQRKARVNRLELTLFVVSFALAVLKIAADMLLGRSVSALLPVVGWLLIPQIWLVSAARRERRGKPGIAIGVGLMASLFSCVFLWLTPTAKPADWSQALLPMILVAACTTVVYAVAGGKRRALTVCAVAAASLLLYTPGAVLCLNELLPANAVVKTPASVLELTSEYDRGDYTYYALIETEAGQSLHQVSHEEYELMEQESAATVITTTGFLGIEYTDVRSDAGDAE